VPVRELCGAPQVSSPGVVFPLHSVGSNTTPRASLAVAPYWLFMHLPSKPAGAAISRCQSIANVTLGSEPGSARAAATAVKAPVPFIMGHLAGIRTGAWSRRALMRAYGWWHPSADLLIAKQLHWGRRGRTLSLFPAQTVDALNLLGAVIRSQAHLDMLVANLLLLGSLLGRRPIVPEIPCGLFPALAAKRGYGLRPVAARTNPGQSTSCAWMPPKACWTAEYTTELEAEIEGLSSASPSRSSNSATSKRKLASTANRRAANGRPMGSGAATSDCDEAARELMHALAPAAARVASAAVVTGASAMPRNNSALLALRRRLRELPCDASTAVSLLPTPQGGAILARNRSTPRTRHRIHILEQLTHTPLLRRQKWSVQRTLSNVTSPLLHVSTLQADVPCVEALFQASAILTSS